MPFSRRKFLKAGAVAAVAAGTPISMNALTASANAAKGGLTTTSAKAAANLMSKSQFESQLNTTFFIRTTAQREVAVKLVELEERVPEHLQDAAAMRGHECFSLAFRGPSKAIKQDTYRVRHTALGEFDLFMGTVENKKHGRIYEAIINHLLV